MIIKFHIWSYKVKKKNYIKSFSCITQVTVELNQYKADSQEKKKKKKKKNQYKAYLYG